MIYTYDELIKLKRNGKELNWKEITRDQLANLFFVENISSSLIADLYNVSINQVKYKRKKLDITMNSTDYYNRAYEEVMKSHPELEIQAKERLIKEENIDMISKAITHYIFRNGPVEDIHAEGKLTQEDMKTLNKFMVNRIAGLLKIALDGHWSKLELMTELLKYYGTEWDKAEYDTKEIDECFKHECINFREEKREKKKAVTN